MQLRGTFTVQFEVPKTPLAWLRSSRRDSLTVFGMLARETFPAQYCGWKNIEGHTSSDHCTPHLAVPENESSKMPALSINRLQLPDEECTEVQRRNCGQYVVREAILDEEYWMASWLRAEARWESLSVPPYMRHVLSYRIKYAEEEFCDLKRRCFGKEGNSLKCFCFVAVRKEDKNVKRTVLKSIVGTLDLSIRQFVQGETYPTGRKRLSAVLATQEPCDAHKYAYIANVSVPPFARRQGVASNMVYLATDVAVQAGMKHLYVHADADNKPAQDLYKKCGFKVVEVATSHERILMSMEL